MYLLFCIRLFAEGSLFVKNEYRIFTNHLPSLKIKWPWLRIVPTLLIVALRIEEFRLIIKIAANYRIQFIFMMFDAYSIAQFVYRVTDVLDVAQE